VKKFCKNQWQTNTRTTSVKYLEVSLMTSLLDLTI